MIFSLHLEGKVDKTQQVLVRVCRKNGLHQKCIDRSEDPGRKGIFEILWPSIFFLNLFIYLRLCWVFVSVRGLPLVAASGGHSSSRCAGLSLSRPLLLRSTGSRRAGSVIVAHGPSCSVACGIFPDQGSNPSALHWQADSQPLHHQGSPPSIFLFSKSGTMSVIKFAYGLITG